MKKQKKQPVQIDLWGNKVPDKKTKTKKFSQFDAERALIVQMLNDEKKRKEGEK